MTTTKNIKHVETTLRNIYNVYEENTNFMERFGYPSHLLKTNIPGREKSILRPCEQYSKLFIYFKTISFKSSKFQREIFARGKGIEK